MCFNSGEWEEDFSIKKRPLLSVLPQVYCTTVRGETVKKEEAVSPTYNIISLCSCATSGNKNKTWKNNSVRYCVPHIYWGDIDPKCFVYLFNKPNTRESQWWCLFYIWQHLPSSLQIKHTLQSHLTSTVIHKGFQSNKTKVVDTNPHLRYRIFILSHQNITIFTYLHQIWKCEIGQIISL